MGYHPWLHAFRPSVGLVSHHAIKNPIFKEEFFKTKVSLYGAIRTIIQWNKHFP